MEKEWKEVRLGDVVTLNYGKGLTEKNRINGNVPVYSSAGLTGWHNKPLINKKGIIIGRKGTVGSVHYSKHSFYCIDTAYYITEDDTKEDLKYLYYLLKLLPLDKLNTDSAVPGLNRDNAYSQVFNLPPLPEQKRIAEILSSLDDKIELNNEMNKTLEEMAQAIFKQWFVDFEFPNENGEPYKLSGGEMVESELGQIPKGWRVGKLGEIIEFVVDNRGKTPPITEEIEEKYPLIEVNALTHNSRIVMLDSVKKFVSRDTYDNWFRKGHPRKGDVLISTVGSIGELALVGDEKICIAQNIISIRGKADGIYMYQLLLSIVDEIKSLDISSVQPSIKVPHLLNTTILIPEIFTINSFVSITRSISENILIDEVQIGNLKKIRDIILPKLMNGDIEI